MRPGWYWRGAFKFTQHMTYQVLPPIDLVIRIYNQRRNYGKFWIYLMSAKQSPGRREEGHGKGFKDCGPRKIWTRSSWRLLLLYLQKKSFAYKLVIFRQEAGWAGGAPWSGRRLPEQSDNVGGAVDQTGSTLTLTSEIPLWVQPHRVRLQVKQNLWHKV